MCSEHAATLMLQLLSIDNLYSFRSGKLRGKRSLFPSQFQQYKATDIEGRMDEICFPYIPLNLTV